MPSTTLAFAAAAPGPLTTPALLLTLAAPRADVPLLVGSLGVGLLLVAFFLSLFGLLAQQGRAYALMNVAGGALSCYASWLIDYLPFVVLEGTWAVVAFAGLVKALRARREPRGSL